MKKTIYLICGYASVGLGFLGIFLPVLPTTPFLLLAVFCFSRSSPRMNRWLMGNRFFGDYLHNYREGRGIPLGVKVGVLSFLWVTILCSAILLIDPLWLKILLITIAAGVTVHLSRVKTLRSGEILVVFPTAAEAAPFAKNKIKGVSTAITGIGPIETATNLWTLIHYTKPAKIIMAGIAGAYPGKDLKKGEVVLVTCETDADTGSFSGGGFEPKFSRCTYCLEMPRRSTLRRVRSNSVSAAASPYADRSGAEIENMEGSAFFRICAKADIPFIEIRAISNIVGEEFASWDIEGATGNLATELKKLIDEI